jgi:hypothetical protein
MAILRILFWQVVGFFLGADDGDARQQIACRREDIFLNQHASNEWPAASDSERAPE